MKLKTRHAYGTYIGDNSDNHGKVFDLGDTIDQALKANMMFRDFESALVKANPQLKIEFRIETKE